MRLSADEKKAILDATRSIDPHSRVFVFGSRVDPKLRGGDIDLLVISDKVGFPERITILVEIKKQIGEQKVDLVVRTHAAAPQDPFVQSIKDGAVELK